MLQHYNRRQAGKYIDGLTKESLNQDELISFLNACDNEIIDTEHAKKLIGSWKVRMQTTGSENDVAEAVKPELFQQLGRVCKKGALTKEILDILLEQKLCNRYDNQVRLDEESFNAFCKVCAERSMSNEFLTVYLYFLIGFRFAAGTPEEHLRNGRVEGGLGDGGKLTHADTLYNLCRVCEEGALSDGLDVLQITEKIPESKFKVIEKAFGEKERSSLREKLQVGKDDWKKFLLKSACALLVPIRIVVETVTLPLKLLFCFLVVTSVFFLKYGFDEGLKSGVLRLLKLITYPIVAPFAYVYSAIKNAKDTCKAIDSDKKLLTVNKYTCDAGENEVTAKTLGLFVVGATTTSVTEDKNMEKGSLFLPNKVIIDEVPLSVTISDLDCDLIL